MSAITASGRQSACFSITTCPESIARRYSNIAIFLGLFAILICGIYAAVHYRGDIAASLRALNLAAVRYETVGMLSVP